MENGLLKKVRRNQTTKPTIRLGRHLDFFQAIKEYADEQKESSIGYLCRILSVSRSGYYKWLHHQETTSEQENTRLEEQGRCLIFYYLIVRLTGSRSIFSSFFYL